jgi:hypothetical protein
VAIQNLKKQQNVMSPERRRAAIVAVLARGVVRWRDGQIAGDVSGDAATSERVSEISRNSLGEPLDPCSVPSLSVDDDRCV